MKIIINETQYTKLLEQLPGNTKVYDWQKYRNTDDSLNKNSIKGLVDILQKARGYHEMHNQGLEFFSQSLISWTKKNPSYNPTFMISSIAILFNESKLDFRELLKAKEIGGEILNFFNLPKNIPYIGGDRSVGYAQIKPSVAKSYGIDPTKLHNMEVSFDAVYKMMVKNYSVAKKLYNGTSVNVYEKGVLKQIPAINNDAALHLAIAGHNAGIYNVVANWCETDMKGIANKCSQKSRKVYNDKPEAITNQSKKIPNYFPNIGGHLHTYVNKAKNYFEKMVGLPKELNKVISNSKNIA